MNKKAKAMLSFIAMIVQSTEDKNTALGGALEMMALLHATVGMNFKDDYDRMFAKLEGQDTMDGLSDFERLLLLIHEVISKAYDELVKLSNVGKAQLDMLVLAAHLDDNPALAFTAEGKAAAALLGQGTISLNDQALDLLLAVLKELAADLAEPQEEQAEQDNPFEAYIDELLD